MFGWKNKVVKHGVLYGSRGKYVQTCGIRLQKCGTCGWLYANSWKNVKVRVSILTGKRYLETKCPECGAANSEEISEALKQAQERPAD